MTKRELTPIQKIIISEIPEFFQWHEHCQKQVEDLLENAITGNYNDDLKRSKNEENI